MSSHSDSRIRDSLVIREKLVTKLVPVPLSTASLSVSAEDLARTPPRASYTDRQGQASVELKYINDTIYVTANCDSLSLVCESYEKEISHLICDYEEIITDMATVKTVKPVTGYIVAFLCGGGVCLLLTCTPLKRLF